MALFDRFRKKKEAKKDTKLKDDEQYKLEVDPQENQDDGNEPEFMTLALTKKQKKTVIDVVMNQVDESKSFKERNCFLELLKYGELRYEMIDYDDDWPWEFAQERRTGTSRIAVNRMKPRINHAFYRTGKIIDVSPEKGNEVVGQYEAAEEISSKQEKWIDSTIRYDMKFQKPWAKILHYALFFNFGLCKNAWEYKEEVKTEHGIYESAEELVMKYPEAQEDYPQLYEALKMGKAVPITETYKEITNGLRPKFIDPSKVILPEGIDDINEAWYVIEEQEYTRAELVQKATEKFFTDVKKVYGDQKADEDPNKKYKVYEVELRYDITGSGIPQHVIVWIAEGTGKENSKEDLSHVYLRGIEFPYNHGHSHWIIFRSEEPMHGFYKGGYAANLKSVNEAEDRSTNLIANAGDKAAMKPWIHDVSNADTPFDPELHRPGVNQIIPTMGKDELTELGTSDVPNSTFMRQGMDRQEASQIIGTDFALTSGHVSAKDPEAPGNKTDSLIEQGNISASDYVAELGKGFSELGFQVQAAYYQFFDKDTLIYKTDTGFDEMSKALLKHPAYFSCRTAVDSVSRKQKARENLQILTLLAEHPLTAQNYPLQERVMKMILSNWSEEVAKAAEEFISPEMRATIDEMIQKAAMLEQQQQLQMQQESQVPEVPAQAGGMQV